MFRPSMRALILWSLRLPLLIILDRAIQGCPVEQRGTRPALCVQDQCPNLPRVTRKKKREWEDPAPVCVGVFPHHSFATLIGKGQSNTFISLELRRGDLTKHPQKTN